MSNYAERRIAKEGSTPFKVDLSSVLFSLPAFLCVVGLFLYPFLYGLNLSFHGGVRGEGGWTLDNYIQFFTTDRQVSTIFTTFQVALPVTIASIVVSVPLAYFIRRGIMFERLITIILILPVTLGTVMVAQAMLKYFGPVGWFNQVLLATGIIKQPLKLIHNLVGVEIALFILGFPFTFLMILGYMSGINPDLEKASRMLGAGRWQTFWRVIFPLSLPGIAIAFCLNFVANFGVFPSAQLVGEPNVYTRVMSIAAYQAAFEDYTPQIGTAIAVIMGVLELSVIVLIILLRNRLARGGTIGSGKGV